MFFCLRITGKSGDYRYKIYDTKDGTQQVLSEAELKSVKKGTKIIGLKYSDKKGSYKADWNLYDYEGTDAVLRAFVSYNNRYLIVSGGAGQTRIWIVKKDEEPHEVYVDDQSRKIFRDAKACWWHCMRAISGSDRFMCLETGEFLD